MAEDGERRADSARGVGSFQRFCLQLLYRLPVVGCFARLLREHRRTTVFSEYPALRERVSQAMMQRENKESLYPARWLSAEAFELFAHLVWLPSRAVVYANLLSRLQRTQLINLISCTQGESSLTRSDQAERIARFEGFTYLDVSDGYKHDSGDNLEVLLHNLQI